MADAMEIAGVEQFATLARRLKEVGDTGLRKELFAAIGRAAAPLKTAVQASARDQLPAAGGLGAFVAAAGITVKKSAGRDPGVRIASKRGGTAETGTLRHPVFGNRDRWVEQKVRPGWFTLPLEAAAPAVRAELLRVIDDVARKVADG